MNNTVLAVGLNPVMQKTLILEHLWENEVNRSSRYYFTVAGKGANTARVLTQLGVPALHLTHAGGSHEKMFKDMLLEDHVNLYCVSSGSEIRLCYTLLNKERHTVTEIVEEAQPVESDTHHRMRSKYLELLSKADIIIISGTKAAGYPEDIIPWMVEQGEKTGKRVILDICGEDLLRSLPYHPYIIKPNMKEFLETLFPNERFREHGSEESVLEEVRDKMISLHREQGIITVLTRGIKPVLSCNGNEVLEHPVIPVKPVNTIGSGDSFTAGLAYGVSRGISLSEAVSIGLECGRKNALNIKPGTIIS